MRVLAALLILVFGSIASVPPVAAQQAETRLAASSAFDQAIENAKSEMMADPTEALKHSDRALKLATDQEGSERDVNRATALWLKAESLIGLNRLDEAGEFATEALAIIETAQPDTKLHGDLLRARGAVRALSGKVQEALVDYQAAHEIFRTAGVDRSQALALMDIGQIYWEAGDYKRTLRYYNQAVEIYNDDPGFALSNHNNLGEAYKMLERFSDAEREYGLAIEAARTLESPLLETRILSNVALVQIEQGKLAEANTTAIRALRLADSGEAADWRSFVLGVRARIAFEQGQLVEAGRYLDQTFAGANFDETDLVYREFHELGAQVFEQLGRDQKALAHLKAFQRLDSQARDLTASASTQLMAAQFDFANQNLRISQLKQGQLERDIQIERQRSEFRTTVFTGFAISVTVVLLLVLFAFFSIRRSRNEVRAANTELQVVNTDLEHALKAKTDFLAMTSHEIRTPLNGILGTSQVLLANRGIDEESMSRVKLIHNAGETMKALVDDLLDVAKMQSGEVTIEPAPTQIRALLSDSSELWRSKIASKGLDFALELGELPDWIETDEGRVRQVVFNLLSNAVKFTHEGAITLAAFVNEDSSRVAVEVRDTGIGIPEEEKAKVFEAFHQVDSATTREFSGTGLGLSICQKLASALGGKIEVESALGVGSTFRLVLPVINAQTDQTQDRRAPEDLSECRLGIIEENAMKQAILVGLLEPHSNTVTAFSNTEDAAQALATQRIDHVVIDTKATLDFDDPLGKLREFVETANSVNAPVTVLYTIDDRLPLEKASQLSHAGVLLKPVSGDALITGLKQHYAKREPAKQGAEYASAA